MSTFLKYLDRYEEKGNDVIFYLKEFPTSRIAGNTIVRELYIYFFHDEGLQLNRIYKIDEWIYKVEKEQKYLCLNCQTPIFFDQNYNYIITCKKCNWRNELNDTPAIRPIIIKTKTFKDYSSQICYPLIEEADLNELPEQLRNAIETFFREPSAFTKEMYQNIYHNLFKKDIDKWKKIEKKYHNKTKLALFFKNTNLFK